MSKYEDELSIVKLLKSKHDKEYKTVTKVNIEKFKDLIKSRQNKQTFTKYVSAVKSIFKQNYFSHSRCERVIIKNLLIKADKLLYTI